MKLLSVSSVVEYNTGFIAVLGANCYDTIRVGDVFQVDRSPAEIITAEAIEFRDESAVELATGAWGVLYVDQKKCRVDLQADDQLYSFQDARRLNSPELNAAFLDDLKGQPVRKKTHKRLDALWPEHREYIGVLLLEFRKAGLDTQIFEATDDGKASHKWGRFWEALPILKSQLEAASFDDIKLILVKLITNIYLHQEQHVFDSKDLMETLIKEFENTQSYPLRLSLAFAIGEIADDSLVEKIVEVVKKQEYRLSRLLIVNGFEKMRSPLAVDCLIELLEDPFLCCSALTTLGALEAKRALTKIEPYLKSDDFWIRRTAKRAMDRIRKVNFI